MKSSSRFDFLLSMSIVLLFSINSINAQEYSFGVKGGLNYSVGNDGSEIAGSLGQFSAESGVGYLFGGFGELTFNKFLVRSEVFYSHVTSEFNFPDLALEYNISKINIPLLVGYNVYGPIDVYAGPSYQNITNFDFQNVEDKIEINQKEFNAHFGIKFIYVKWEVDLRYEYVPTSKSNQIIDIENVMENAYFDDGRLNNIMLSVNYKFLDTKTYKSKEVIDE